MGIIRRHSFMRSTVPSADRTELIDTPEKLISFAKTRNIETVPFAAEKVAVALGITVKYEGLLNEVSGILQRKDDLSGWEIVVNSAHHLHRQRYTIAHELGHYCLHRFYSNNFEDDIFFRSAEISQTEWEANDFAGAILIPEDVFRSKLREGVNDVEALAKVFKVSSLALRMRAKKLGMSGHGL